MQIKKGLFRRERMRTPITTEQKTFIKRRRQIARGSKKAMTRE